MNKVLDRMMAELSNEDKKLFEDLSKKLKSVNGDIDLMSDEDIELISQMERKYGEKINRIKQSSEIKNTEKNQSSVSLLDTPFAQQVRQIIARDLGATYPLEEDALSYVFETKWLPIDCKDPKLSDDLYQRFTVDINEANQWREDFSDVNPKKSQDKSMALGLAWFMVIYQMYKRLNGK